MDPEVLLKRIPIADRTHQAFLLYKDAKYQEVLEHVQKAIKLTGDKKSLSILYAFEGTIREAYTCSREEKQAVYDSFLKSLEFGGGAKVRKKLQALMCQYKDLFTNPIQHQEGCNDR